MRHTCNKTLALLVVVTALFGPAAAVAGTDKAAPTGRVELAIGNMTCGICPITMRKALQAVPGVASVSVDYATMSAIVHFDPRRTSASALTAATADAGHPSTVRK